MPARSSRSSKNTQFDLWDSEASIELASEFSKRKKPQFLKRRSHFLIRVCARRHNSATAYTGAAITIPSPSKTSTRPVDGQPATVAVANTSIAPYKRPNSSAYAAAPRSEQAREPMMRPSVARKTNRHMFRSWRANPSIKIGVARSMLSCHVGVGVGGKASAGRGVSGRPK